MHDTFLYLQTHNGLGLENESFEHLYEHFPIYTMVSEFAGPYDKQPIPPVSAVAPRAPVPKGGEPNEAEDGEAGGANRRPAPLKTSTASPICKRWPWRPVAAISPESKRRYATLSRFTRQASHFQLSAMQSRAG